MANLIDRVREISKSIKGLEGLKATEDEAIGFRTRADELSNLATQIQAPVGRIELFRQNGIDVGMPDSQANQLRLKLEAILQGYAANKKSILEPSTEWRYNIKNGLESIAKHGNQQLLLAWTSHVVGLRPPINNGLLILFSRSPAYQSKLRRINELLTELDRLSDQIPSNLEGLTRPAILATEARALLAELPEEIPDEVRALFQSINENTATAAHLTDTAAEWLKENEMLSDLRISWR